ncbi:MAG TPA: hypothetical protein VMU53_19320 [Candidatus Sulfotelmatobacter sp.]|nr:hypothetical protein [Candidatus Sulfotelmatobacter sp.]
MANTSRAELLPCDGCGQLADSAHISRRLERLAWSTRYRPVHIQALLLSGIAPREAADFVYAPNFGFTGEGADLLHALQIRTEGKSPEAVQGELQKLGILLTHILECPLDASVSAGEAYALTERQLPATMARIRRSLKPKRVLLLSADLLPYAAQLRQANLQCPVLPSSSGVFLATQPITEEEGEAFRNGLGLTNPHAV